MLVYIDENYECKTEKEDGRRGFEVPYFDGKCRALIESYRYIPDGESFNIGDGTILRGEMVSPIKKKECYSQNQEQYVEDCDNMMSLADVADIVELVYEDDLGIIG